MKKIEKIRINQKKIDKKRKKEKNNKKSKH